MPHFHPRCPPPASLVRPVRIDPDGLTGPPRGTAAGPRWRRSSHGLFVPSDVPLTVEQRIVEASVRLPPAGLVTGWAALRLAGAAYFDGRAADGHTRLPVPVLLPHASRIRGRGLLVERTRRELPGPTTQHGIGCVPEEVALLDELRRSSSALAAGTAVDMALAAGVVDLDHLRLLAARRRQLPHTTYAVDRACGECRSPRESEMLQVWEGELGLPRPLMNRQVLDRAGRLVAVVDLLDVESGTYGEYNGAAHRGRERQRRDEARADDLRSLGLEGFVLVAGDPRSVWTRRMTAARSRAHWEPAGSRRWQAGAFVPAPPLPDAEQAAVDAIMDEHHRSFD